ncbi:GxxExxY protein [Patescibacteria group bacterium]|nr:GxxExxY protein [Patescibacteria group bacterium]
MENEKYLHSEITGKILQAFYQVFNNTGYGFDRSVYIKSLHIELQKAGLKSECNKTVEIYYQTKDIGNFISDIVVEDSVLLKICTKEELTSTDEQMLFNHLKVSILEVGLLLNFGISPQHKRKVYTNDRKCNMS